MSRGLLIVLGAILSAGIAVAARGAGALTWDGAVAAVMMGTLVFGFGGWQAALLLLTFFISSSLLTRWGSERKSHPEHRRGRSAGQVFANGFIASALAVWSAVSPSPAILAALAAAIATSTADTWATEIGFLSPSPPRLITTWQVVPAGQSGAISPLGTMGGIAGALLVAAAGFWWVHTPFGVVWAAGVAAMLLDSLLGATVEGRIRGFNNDATNLIATAAGALIALLLS